MQETRIFIEITKHDNGDIDFFVAGGTCNNGQGEFHSSLSSAITDLN